MVDGRDVPVPGGGEQGHDAVPACGTAHGSAVWPEPSDPDGRSRALDRRRQQGDILDAVVAPVMVDSLARPVALQQVQAFVGAHSCAIRVQVVELRRRPLSRARGNRDKPHLCAGFTLK
jgi:hypothetical protein